MTEIALRKKGLAIGLLICQLFPIAIVTTALIKVGHLTDLLKGAKGVKPPLLTFLFFSSD